MNYPKISAVAIGFYAALAIAGPANLRQEADAPLQLPADSWVWGARAMLTDAACMNDCTRGGHQYDYCVSRCTVQPPPISPAFPRHGIDYKCLNECTSRGSQYSFCKAQCTY
jgi:hypothetical protein